MTSVKLLSFLSPSVIYFTAALSTIGSQSGVQLREPVCLKIPEDTLGFHFRVNSFGETDSWAFGCRFVTQKNSVFVCI